MAAQGLRDVGDGREAIVNASEADELRARGRRITWMSAAGSLLATAIVVIAMRA